jgi:hypothetical protein
MSVMQKFTDPVSGDEVPKVDDAVAIGEDLAFQERWWKFERIIWSLFLLILLADVLGVFGRGWLAKAQLKEAGSGMQVDYERVARASTPSIMRIQFDPDTVVHGELRLFIGESLVKELGTQRVVPEPDHSIIGDGGITYIFPAQSGRTEVQLALEPSFPGIHRFTLQVPGKLPVGAHIAVVP